MIFWQWNIAFKWQAIRNSCDYTSSSVKLWLWLHNAMIAWIRGQTRSWKVYWFKKIFRNKGISLRGFCHLGGLRSKNYRIRGEGGQQVGLRGLLLNNQNHNCHNLVIDPHINIQRHNWVERNSDPNHNMRNYHCYPPQTVCWGAFGD